MKKHKKMLSFLTASLVSLGSFNSLVFAQDDTGITNTPDSDDGPDSYYVTQVENSESIKKDSINDKTFTYQFDSNQVDLSIIAWHQKGNPDGATLAASAPFIQLKDSKNTEKTFTLDDFYGSGIRGNLAVVVKAKTDYLITKFESNGSQNIFVPLSSDYDGTGLSHQGVDSIGKKAFNQYQYQAIFGYYVYG